MAPTGGMVQRRLVAAPLAMSLLTVVPSAPFSTSRAGPTHAPLPSDRHRHATRQQLPHPRRRVSILRR